MIDKIRSDKDIVRVNKFTWFLQLLMPNVTLEIRAAIERSMRDRTGRRY